MAKNRKYLGQFKYTPQAAKGTEANILKWQTNATAGVGEEGNIAYSTDNDDLYVSDGNRFLKALVLRDGNYLNNSLTVDSGLVIVDLSDLGTEKVLTGDFSADTDWTKGTGWTIEDGVAKHSSDGASDLEQDISAVAGEYYLLTFSLEDDGTNNTSGDITPEIGGVAGIKVWADHDGTSRTFTQIIKATGTGNLKFTSSDAARLAIDNVSVKKVNKVVEINPTEGVVLVGDATVLEDLQIPLSSTILGGSKDPDLALFKDDGAGSQGVFSYMFDKTIEEELYFTVQMPHRWKEGSELRPHVHWTPTNTDTGSVVWGLEYTWANIGDTYGDTDILYLTATPEGTAHKHYLSSFSHIDGTGKTSSSMLVCRVFRAATDGSDTYNADAALLEIDFHYEVDRMGEASLP